MILFDTRDADHRERWGPFIIASIFGTKQLNAISITCHHPLTPTVTSSFVKFLTAVPEDLIKIDALFYMSGSVAALSIAAAGIHTSLYAV